MTAKTCVHCGLRLSYAARGLCKTCYGTPEILVQYPPRRTYTQREGLAVREDSNSRRRRPPEEPTEARPGSEEKIAALAERLASGRHLWHPDDPSIRPEVGETTGEKVYRASGVQQPQCRHSWMLL